MDPRKLPLHIPTPSPEKNGGYYLDPQKEIEEMEALGLIPVGLRAAQLLLKPNSPPKPKEEGTTGPFDWI